MAKYTSGPWYAKRYERERPDTWAGWHIQDRDGHSAPPDVAYVDDADYGPEVAEANARLLAAAPDLLEALYILLVQFGEYKDGDGACKYHAIKIAKAAIAKAEGEEGDNM